MRHVKNRLSECGPDALLQGFSGVVLLVALAACGGAEPAGDDASSEGGGAAAESSSTATAAEPPLTVYAVNYPMSYLAERVGGEHVEVVLPRVLAQGDPAYAQPDAEVIAELQGADLIVRNGAGYAQWFDMVTLPAAKVVDASAAFADRIITIEEALTHSHGPEGEHSHDQTAATTWLDPLLAIEQAAAIAAALSERRPAATTELEANLAALRDDLTALDEQFTAAAAALGNAPLLASYPLYQYFARRYGLDLEAVQLESWAAPTEEQWGELTALHAEHPARWMIWESQPVAETRERLEAMGIGIIVVDPCATPPDEGDYLSVMRANAANLSAATIR